ncbi:hypothetical protein JHK82_055508 [Glycine max]|uniref:Uncharacterized protein n=1 Tax=Glycine soja TaxID=3848 RepID=A0A0B2PIT6_GLYSO|nr:hypothetical protein JHK82_055508 [Glycine max]KHN07477.1 hypothetical protein glysoja_049199 [Glycine soja]
MASVVNGIVKIRLRYSVLLHHHPMVYFVICCQYRFKITHIPDLINECVHIEVIL